MQNNNFYRAFEERYYAPREVIKSLRKQYLPFVQKLMEIYPVGHTFDLGCGRGEWLELMRELGLIPYGVDLDDGMLQGCVDLGLAAEKGNAVLYLQTLKSESQLIISAFHVVEHISFEDLQIVVQEALRVLKPGGLLILETPNPENLKVASENFYLDPTHIKPIPSKLLSFLPEFFGYNRTKVMRLQEPKDLLNNVNINLLQVIEGVSPDYAVIAQKEASADILQTFDELFNYEFGLSLSTLTEKFENRLLNIEAKVSEAEAKASEAEAKASEAEAKASEAEAKASEAEIRTNDALHSYHTVINSNSWKIMKPFRIIGKFTKWFYCGIYHWITFSPTSRPRRILKQVLASLKDYINNNPKLKYKVMQILNKFPTIKNRLKKIASTYVSNNKIEINELTERGNEVYKNLSSKFNKEKN